MKSTTPPTASHRLAPVVVSATRTADDALQVPAAIDVVTAEALHRARPGIDLSESLQRVPGLVVRDRHNQAQDLQISIRGHGARATFGVRGVRLYTDGIPATMPDGQGQVSHFPLKAAERIEVLRGPFSALHGNASGGVIELFTAPAPATPELELEHVAGSDGLSRPGLSWRGPVGSAGLSADASELQLDGYRQHSRARRRNAQANLRGELGEDTRYTVLLNGLDLVADDPQGLTAAELDGDRRAASPNSLRFDARKTVRQDQAGVRIEHALSPTQALSLVAHRGNRQTFQVLTVPVAVQATPSHGGGVIDLDRDYHGLDARWQWRTRWQGQPVTLTVGMQQETAAERRQGFENFLGERLGVVGERRRDEDNRVTGDDQYLQLDWQPAPRWRVNAGLRHSRVAFRSRDHYVTPGNPDDSGRLRFANTSPVAGVLFRARPWLSLYANIGEGFETPTFAELAYRADGGSGLNTLLRPARSRNQELGLRGRRGGHDWSVALFQGRTRDELAVIANAGGRSVFGNVGASRRRGLELSASGNWSERWHYAAAYTFLDARYLREDAQARIPGLSRHFAWAEMRWNPAAGLDLILEGRFSDRVPVDDDNSAAAPAYASFDLALERRGRIGALQWRGYARLNNLADRAYVGSVIVNEANGRYFEPAPGRHWLIGLALTHAMN